MKHGWKTTAIYLAIAWMAYFVFSFTYNFALNLSAMALYVILLLSGAIAMIVLLIRGFLKKRGKLAALAMVLAVVPLVIPADIQEVHARARDFLLREQRMEVIDDLRSGRLEADGNFRTQLPEGRRHLAEDGDICVFEMSGERQAVGFYHLSTILGGAKSTVYCSDGNPPTTELLGTQAIHSCKPLGDGWYYVAYE